MTSQYPRDELASAVTHGAGILLSMLGGAALIVLASLRGTAADIAGVSVFVASLLLLYSASTIFHAARAERTRRRLQVLDHCAIYVLIAGTYTPFMLGGMRGPWGWSIFGVIWGLAVAGVVFKLFFTGRFQRLSTAIYVAMGWLILIAAVPLFRHFDARTLTWLLAGGITYTAGTLFYHSRRVPYAHAVWHLFVLAGSICHGIAVAMQL